MSIIDCNYSVTGSGPAIFLTHGVGGAEDAWRFITPKLNPNSGRANDIGNSINKILFINI